MSDFLGGLVGKVSSALGIGAPAEVESELHSFITPDTINSLVARADSMGLTDHVRSWIGTGENLPVSVDQIRSLLGNAQVEALVARTGLPADALLPALANFLPAAVDKKTPDGTI